MAARLAMAAGTLQCGQEPGILGKKQVLDPKLLPLNCESGGRVGAPRVVLDVEAIAGLEERRKAAQVEADRIRAERNANAKATGQAKAQGRDAAPLLALGNRCRPSSRARG